MNELEAILSKEKEASHRLARKDTFITCTLALISQQEKLARTRRRLVFCGLLAFALTLPAIPFIESFINTYTDSLVNILIALVYDPFIVYVSVLLLSGFLVINRRTS